MTFNWIQYKALNPNLEIAGIKTEQQYKYHYNSYGKNENRMASIYDLYPDFNWEQYQYNYPNLDFSSKELYENHWLQYGRYEDKVYNSKLSRNLISSRKYH